MTAPPSDPSGQGPYGTNPYGQQPYWGGQPQGGPYPYPPGGPYGAYPPPQFGQPGQQFPPGWPAGPYSPGPPPPRGPRSKTPWLIAAGIAVLVVIGLVVIVVIGLTRNENKSTPASPPVPSATKSTPTTSPPNPSAQTATNCTPNVSGGDEPVGDMISAGKLSFPAAAAPEWSPFPDAQNPNLIDAVGLGQEVPGANGWMMLVEVAVTNFVATMDVTAQASKLMQCVANGPGYISSKPTLGPTKSSSIMVDGTKAARVDADITVADSRTNVKGDSVTIIAVDTKPVTIFMAATPIGDAASKAIANRVIAALKVVKS